MARGTILIVEPSNQLRNSLVAMVRHWGFDVLVATDGEEAIAALNTASVDIVVTAIDMPRLDGYGLIQWMQARSLTHPILVINHHDSLQNAVQALRLGAYDYIDKPFDREAVKAALCRAEASVEHRRADGALRQRNRELAALNAISTALSNSLELKEMLDHALGATVEALELTSALIYLGDTSSGLTLYHCYGEATSVTAQMPVSLPVPIQQTVALGTAQIAQLLGNTAQVVWHGNDTLHAAIPLLEQGLPCGLLLLAGSSSTPIHHDQFALLQSIGNYIGVAIANARLYSEVRDSALLLERLVAERTQELERSRDLLRTIFDGIPNGLLLVDSEGQVLAANGAYANMVDIQPEMLYQQTYSQIWSAPWFRTANQLVQRCVDERQVIYQRDHVQRPRHATIVFDHYLFPIYDAEGYIIQIIEYLEDITERLAMEHAFIQTEQLAALSKLVATVAHEVNTPLLAIRGCLGLLDHPQTSKAARREYLAMAEDELDRAAAIIRVMLDLYQSTGDVPRSTDVNALIERIAHFIRTRCVQRSIEVELDLTADLPSILVTPDQLKQVMLNLILSAIEVLPDGGRIILRTFLHSHTSQAVTGSQEHGADAHAAAFVVIEVEDTSGGTLETLQQRGFDAFATSRPGSSGLGLAVCQAIIQNEGGSIQGTHIPGSGACFTVTFPVGIPPASYDPQPLMRETAYESTSHSCC